MKVMEYIPDNYDIWASHEADEARQLEKYPICADCEQPITDDHFYEINGEHICPDCLEAGYRKDTDDFIE